MNTILEENREAVRAVGRRLMEIGAVLAEGKIEEAWTQAATARRTYRAWEELDQARADIEGVIRDEERMRATRRELAELLGTIIRAALLPRLP